MSNRVNFLAIFACLFLLLLGWDAWVTEQAFQFGSYRFHVTGLSAKLFGLALLFSAFSILVYWCFPSLSKNSTISALIRDLGFFFASICFLAGISRAIYVALPHL